MKLSHLIITLIFVLSVYTTHSQNTYDNYGNFTASVPTFDYLYTGSSYAGEYQIHLRTNL